MARKLGLLMALALSVLAPAGVSSLGLGEIRLNSYLNEPLDAEVTISVSGPEELETLQVAVASEEAFGRFGVDRPRFLDELTFVIDATAAGSATLRIRSPEAVIEPFLTFLIEANWAGGRLLREYTVLLDPPLFLPEPPQQEQPAPPVAQTPGAGVISRPAPAPQAAPAPRATVAPPAVVAPSTYGPVKKNDTLWRIASEVRPDRSVSVNQTMLALFEANPDAFDGNINLLQEGAVLNVPSRDTISRVAQARATAEVRRQHTQWQPGDAAAAPAPIVPVATQSQPAEPVEERLELVVPGQPGTAPAPGVDTGAPSAEYLAEQQELNREMLSALSALREELDETKRLIELKDAEISSLQGRIGELEPVAPGAGEAAPEAPQTESPTTGVPIDAPVSETPVGEFVAEPAPVEPETPAVEQTPEPVVAPAPAEPPPAAIKPADSGGLFSSIWMWILAALAVIGAAVFVWKRRQEETDESFGVLDTVGGASTAAAPVAVAAATEEAFLVEEQPAPGVAAESPRADDSIGLDDPVDFDSTGSFVDTDADIADNEATDVVAERTSDPMNPTDTRTDYQYPFEDTIAGASGIDLDQSDPLAEADFHMAYGLYDQAADLIGKSVEREPDRVDLRMKLLDILFVWGKEDRFLAEADALRNTLGDDTSADWGRVVIMGRQICPDEPLFAGETDAGVDVAVDASGGVESAGLSAAAGGLDFDIGAEQETETGEDLLDFDLGNTGERPLAAADGISPDQTAEMEIEDLGLDLDLGEATSEVLAGLAAADAGGEQGLDVNFDALQPDTGLAKALDDPEMLDGGTAEMLMPELGGEDVAGNTAELTGLTEQLEQAARSAGSEDLTELAETLDDPTVLATPEDMTGLTERLLQAEAEALEDTVSGPTLDEEIDTLGETGATDTLDSDEPSETIVASVETDTGASGLTEILDATMSMGDEAGTVIAETLEMPTVKEQEEEPIDFTSETEGSEFSTQRMTAVLEQPELDEEDTAQVEAIEQEDDPSLDLDDITAALSVDLENTAELPRAGDDPCSDTLMSEIFGEDDATRLAPGIDILTQNDEADAQKEETVVAIPPDVTLDEVGTKLDLARAYIDMGDPDGAKSILEEVLNEGSENQKTEAKQLMDGVT